MKTKSVMLGFLIGGVTAGIAVLLSAPSSGKETKSKLQNNMVLCKENLHELKENLADLKNTITYASKEGKESISTFISDIKILFEEWKENIKPNQEHLRNELGSIQAAIEELESNVFTSTKES